MNDAKKHFVATCIIAAVTLAILTGLELAVRTAHPLGEKQNPDDDPTIETQDWGRQYLKDSARLGWRHVNYTEFREQGLASPTINVNPEGLRRVPGNCGKDDAFVVWAFGGSTMFGYGAPDEFTIPAYLAKQFNLTGRCTRVVNYGAASWQSTQSRIQLTQLLARGARPDAVVFYDGINDAMLVTSGGPPGGLEPVVHALLRRALEQPPHILTLAARHSALVAALSEAALQPFLRQQTPTKARVETDVLAYGAAIASVYAHNVRMVDALSKEYGFKAYFYLQPFPLISRKQPTPMERKVLDALPEQQEWTVAVLRSFYAAFAQNAYLAAHPGYSDISAIFDGATEELFADTEHLLPAGNAIVAERIARDVALARTTR